LASEFLQQLSKVYRYVLENKDKDVVTINTEVRFVTHYAHLLKTRFEGALNVNFNIGDDMGESKIVPVTLQVLLENATKHNITSASAPLNINVYTEKDYLVVENNLQRKQIIENSNGQGLENLKTLYYFLSDLPVLVEEKEKSFAVKIPLL
jgi:LytS/YehU family sensor histidine kinase